MHILDEFNTEKVVLQKQDGEKIENIEALVQKDKILIKEVDTPIEEGDLIIRSLPSGLKERYKVLDIGYQKGVGSISEFYDIDVKKITKLDDESSDLSKKTIYNLHGNNPRVNINSNDMSINIVDKSSEELFADLRSTVEKSISGSDKEKLLKKIKELEESKDTNSFPKNYAEFMSLAADHATILASFFPALIQLLT